MFAIFEDLPQLILQSYNTLKIGTTLSWVQLISPITGMISLTTKPFNVKMINYREFLVPGFKYELCFMLIIAIPMYLVIVGMSIYLMVIMKLENRSPWVKAHFDLISLDRTM